MNLDSEEPTDGPSDESKMQRQRGAPPSGRFEDLFLLGGGTEMLPWLTVAQEGRALAVVGPRLDTSDVSRVTHDYVLRWAGQVRWHDTSCLRASGKLADATPTAPVRVRPACVLSGAHRAGTQDLAPRVHAAVRRQ